MQGHQEELKARLREQLDAFLFFHLGADAEVAFREQPGALSISVQHRRVSPFEFTLDRHRLEDLLAKPDELERFLLHQLTLHRR